MDKKIIYIIIFMITYYSALARTYVDGSFIGSSVWTEAESPYIIENDITIQKEATLIIEGGTQIIIADDKLISVKGSLICEGIPGKPVVFSAKSEYWGGIYIDRTADDVRIKFTEFNYGGRSSYTQSSVILINESNVFIEYSKFQNSYLYGITSFRDGYADMGGGNLNSRGFNTFSGFSKNRWAIVNNSKVDIDAAKNCWNAEPSDIIYDYFRNEGRGKVLYEPVSNNCEPQKPDKAKLIFPADSSKDIPVFFNLKWHKLNDVSSYHLQFSDNYQFDELIVNNELTDSIYTMNNLNYGNRYFWRVRGLNFAGNGEWSDTFTFVTYDTSKPGKTNLSNPPNNSLNDCEVFFQWDVLQNADFYNVWITNNNTIIDTIIESNDITLSKFTNDDIIKWKVRGNNRNGFGKWSEEWTFTILGAFSPPDELIYDYNNLINILNTDIGTELFFSDSSETIIYNITENKSKILNFPVDYYTKAYINQNSEYDEVFSQNSKLTIIFDNGEKRTEIHTSGAIKNIKTADMNNNGRNEIICKTISDNTSFLEIFEIKDIHLVKSNITIAVSEKSDFFIIDTDIDGDNDIVVIDNNLLQIYINTNGEFHLSKNKIYLSDVDNPLIYDYNQDGYSDIVVNESTGISFIKNKNGFFQKDTLILNSEYRLNNISDLNYSGLASLMVIDKENNFYEYDIKNNKTKSMSIIGSNAYAIKYNNDNKPDILADSLLYYNNICSDETKLNSPENMRYSFINDSSVILEWDRTKINSNNNYNIIYEISLTNNQNGNTFNFKTKNNFYIINNPEDADYDWKVRAVYNEIHFTEYSTYKGLYTKNALPKPPESWAYINKTGLNTTILLRDKSKIDIKGLSVEYGDALGIFFIRDTSLICGGYSHLNSDKIILTAWGDNQQTADIKDGFAFSEEFRFKYWDASEKKEILINVQFEKGIGWFKPDTLSEIKKISPPDTAHIKIEPNKWNYVSSDIVPFIPFFYQFDKLMNKTVSDINNNIFDNSKDELKYWNTGKGYKIYSATEDTITIFGSRIQPEYHPFKIKKNQWYLLPAIVTDTALVETALKNIYPKIILLKDEQGRIISPKYNIKQFRNLIPNKAYEIFLSEDSEFIINNEKSENTKQPSFHNNLILHNRIIQNSGNNATLIAVFDNHLRGEIAVYAGQDIIGAEVVNSDTVVIPIKGRDITGNISGAEEGEELNIIYSVYDGNAYKTPVNNIFNELTNTSENILNYSQNSFSSINIEIDKILSLNKNNSINVHISPVPVENLLFVNSSEIISSLEILDLSGTIRLSENKPGYSFVFDMSSLPNGIYFVRIKVNNIIDDNKIILEKK